jgi:thioredoxin-like negative regulator of GroEL
MIEELGKEYDGKVDVYKVNVDDERELAKLFNVRSIPTLLFIPMEGNPQMSVGAMSKAELSKRLDELVG